MNQTEVNAPRKLGARGIFVVVSFIVLALIVDTSIVKISAFTSFLWPAGLDLGIFTCMALIFAIGQYVIMNYVKLRERNGTEYDTRLHRIHSLVTIILYTIIAIFCALILQMVLTSSYNVILLQFVISLSYASGIIMLGFLSRRFFSWFRINHNTIVLAYSIATTVIAVNAAFTLLYVNKGLISAERSSPIIHPDMTPVANYTSVYDILNSAYFLTSVLSFILTWIATVLLLRSYMRKFGRGKYWILVSIPMVYFLSQFQPLILDALAPVRLAEPVLFGIFYTLLFSATIPAGGLLFGMAFWSSARSIRNSAVKDYMMISAYGMMLLFCSNQASDLVLVPYPPFGLSAIAFFGLASYLIFVGIYSSAISVAQDSVLRKSIRGIAIKESRLLDSIGEAQMEQQIVKKVIEIGKLDRDKMTEETGIQSSLTEEDMTEYLQQVMREIAKKNDE